MRTSVIQVVFFSTFLLQACTGIFIKDKHRPGPDANTVGIIEVSQVGGQFFNAKSSMESQCADFGGLNESSIKALSPRGFAEYWSYQCNGLKQKAIPTQAPSQSNIENRVDVNSAKVKCTEIGFKSGTEGFGKCVLQLTK